MSIFDRVNTVSLSAALFLFLASGCDDPDVFRADQRERIFENREEIGAPPALDQDSEGDSLPWNNSAVVTDQEDVAELSDYNALLDDGSDYQESPLEEISELSNYSDDDPESATCALELMEPCIANVAICAVRCCDNTLFKSPQVCGNCGTWAMGACANHGTRKRVRWEWP